MRRKLFTIAVGVSAVLGVGMGLLWGLSLHAMQRLGWESNPPAGGGVSGRGAVVDVMANGSSLLITVARWSAPPGGVPSGTGRSPSAGQGGVGSRLFWERTDGHYVWTLYPQFGRYWSYYHWRRGAVAIHLASGGVVQCRGWALRLGAPLPVLILALLAMPAAHLARRLLRIRRRARRQHRNLCPRCGYDLRATPDRCPGCGAVPDQVPIPPVPRLPLRPPRHAGAMPGMRHGGGARDGGGGMRRKLFTLAAGVSAVLLLAVAALWVRSYWVSDTWDREEPGVGVNVGSSRGQVWWARLEF